MGVSAPPAGADRSTPHRLPTTRYYATDVRGSVRATTDERGKLKGTSSYDAWGVPKDEDGGDSDGRRALTSLFGFTGERQDAKAGLEYLRARWYDPAVGVFLSPDPARGRPSDPRTLSPYAYAMDDPASKVDPSGLSATSLLNGSLGYAYYGSAFYADPRFGPAGPTTTPSPLPGPRPSPRLTPATGDWPTPSQGPIAAETQFVESEIAGLETLRTRASALGRTLSSESAPEMRSAAARALPRVGQVMRPIASTLFRSVARAAGPAVIAVDLATNLTKGQPALEAAARTGLRTSGGIGGAIAGGAACGSETVATLGTGALACPVLVIGGGAVGDLAGDLFGNLVFGWEQ